MMQWPETFKPAAVRAIAALAVMIGFTAGMAVGGWRSGAAVADCRADASARDAEAAQQALQSLQHAATAVTEAASVATASSARIAAANDAARRRWDELVKLHPLPAGCAPDQARAQAMRDALERTRELMQ